jgi:DNA-binding MarR family transcriptional regulator
VASRTVTDARQAAIEETALHLRRVLYAMKGRFHEALQETGLTLSQWIVLKELRSRGRLSSSEVAAALDCTPANATGVLDRLERDGLVERTRSEEDRRVIHVNLTPQGTARYADVVGLAPRALDDMFDGWSTRDVVAFRDSLTRLKLRPTELADE